MSVPIARHPSVADDILGIVDQIAADNLDVAARFAPAVEPTIRGLGAFPGKGSLNDYDHPRLAGIRSWAIDGFPNHLVLYSRLADGAIWVLPVTHGARQLPGMLLRRT